VIFLLLACAQDPKPVDLGFVVVGVSPADGADDVVEAHVPELRFSDDIDEDACDADAVRLDGLGDDGTVAFTPDTVLTPVSGTTKVQFVHDVPFPRGWTYAITVRGGEHGCLDADGNEITPFTSTFSVP
jgi:hypothetical protein